MNTLNQVTAVAVEAVEVIEAAEVVSHLEVTRAKVLDASNAERTATSHASAPTRVLVVVVATLLQSVSR